MHFRKTFVYLGVIGNLAKKNAKNEYKINKSTFFNHI